MTLSIKNPKADRLARRLARRMGESLTEAVTRALAERMWRLNCRERYGRLRTPDEINLQTETQLSSLRRPRVQKERH